MVLVYQAYGREDILRQTIFSMISLLHVLKNDSPIQIWVYTDNRKLFEAYFKTVIGGRAPRVRIEEIHAEQIQKWRGAIDFVHRVKIEILKDAAHKFTGSLYYVDGDTYFRKDPTELFSQVGDSASLMHIAENALDKGRDPLSKKIAKFVKKNVFQLNGQSVQISPSAVMYNAGAIGISQNNKKLLEQVIQLTDQMYALYPKHIMEQLAVSFVLNLHSKIIEADKIIGHYWNQKPEYQSAIDLFLQKNPNLESADQKYGQFNWPPPAEIKIKKSFWSTIFR